jgi:hypothetical protein
MELIRISTQVVLDVGAALPFGWNVGSAAAKESMAMTAGKTVVAARIRRIICGVTIAKAGEGIMNVPAAAIARENM